MKGEPQLERTRTFAERAQLARAFRDLAVELRHVGMGDIRRKIGRHPVHADLVRFEIIENFRQIAQRNTQMRLLLAPPAVVALQSRRAQHFHGKTELQRSARALLRHIRYSPVARRRTPRFTTERVRRSSPESNRGDR
jgi:hypothetical protein